MRSPDLDTGTILLRLSALLADGDPAILAAYLFGSVARGDDGPGSDLDLGLLYAEDPPPTFAGLPLELEGELERALGRPVQAVVLNLAPVDLLHRVLRDGRILLDRDRAARLRFEVRARNLYFDLEPHLLRYRRMEPA